MREFRRIDPRPAGRVLGEGASGECEAETEQKGRNPLHARQYLTPRGLDTPPACRINGAAVHPFVKDRADFDRLGARTIEMLGDYLRALPAQPVDRVVPEDIRRRLMALPMPEQGLAPDEMLEFLRREILPWPIAIGHRRSYGWVNSPPAPISILADAVATTMNCGLDGYDHSALFLMSSVGRWIMDLVGFPAEGSLCLLLTGGSAATLNALTAARHRAAEQAGWNLRAEGLQGGRARLVLYASSESHSSIQKCVEQLGIGTDNLREIPVDDDFRMRPDALRQAIEADRTAGHLPFAIVACGGATNTGAIDPLDAIADVAEEFGVWLHVDGAFGAWAALDPAYAEPLRRDRARGFRHAQSAQVAAGAARLRRAADAAPGRASCGFLVDARLPRRRAQRGALALRAHVPAHLRQSRAEDLGRAGAAGAQRAYGAGDALQPAGDAPGGARAGDAGLRAAVAGVAVGRELPLPARGQWTSTTAALDALNGRISAAISDSGEAHLPTSRVRGRTSLRACFLHYENDESDVEHLVQLVRRLGIPARCHIPIDRLLRCLPASRSSAAHSAPRKNGRTGSWSKARIRRTSR